jgi:hypothetical protein
MSESIDVMDKLESQGLKILEGHKDIELISEEVNQIWELEVTKLTKPLRAVIIEQLRNNRKNYAKKKAKPRGKAPAVPVPEGGISLDDLDLDIKL